MDQQMTQEVIEILDLTILSYISFRSLKSLSPSIFYIINIGINAFMNKKQIIKSFTRRELRAHFGYLIDTCKLKHV